MWITNIELDKRATELEKKFEKFSQNIEPQSWYYEGQLWYNRIEQKMKVWNGEVYVDIWSSWTEYCQATITTTRIWILWAWGTWNISITINDSSDWFTESSNIITIPNSGWYSVSCCIRMDKLTPTDQNIILKYVNSAGTWIYAIEQLLLDSSNNYFTFTTTINVSAGATLKIVWVTESDYADFVPVSDLFIIKL